MNQPADNRFESLKEIVKIREHRLRFEPLVLNPYLFRPCKVRVLLVADVSLNFGIGDFGLRAFVDALKRADNFYVNYELTLAHRSAPSDEDMMVGYAGIGRSIKSFRFDNADHFGRNLYDQVWIFSFDSIDDIDGSEAKAVADFMDAEGGVFATGDHGALGRAVGSHIPRVRNMRLWDNVGGEVGMTDANRNDTNRRGHHPSTTFDDQSDDVPQDIQPRLYRVPRGFWDAVFPHPLLCGDDGIIKVMPDHPHEGECVEPDDPDQVVTFDGEDYVEYPAGTNGNPRPLPEVISTNTVIANTRADINGVSYKTPTVAHDFGGISAYDGHRASVGRVVTDATWHHFVNINLIGDSMAAPPKDVGFLATQDGRDQLAKIENYYRNIAVWLAPPDLIRCMNRRILWSVIVNSRIVEASTTALKVEFDQVDLKLTWQIGVHARDVLGRLAGRCQSRGIALWVLERILGLEVFQRIDPWWPVPPPPDPSPWFDRSPLIDLALGGAVLALRDEFDGLDPDALAEVDNELFDNVARRGAMAKLEESLANLRSDFDQFGELIQPQVGGEEAT